jgi:hypothetical protein
MPSIVPSAKRIASSIVIMPASPAHDGQWRRWISRLGGESQNPTTRKNRRPGQE